MIYYRPQGKVMSSEVSVILSTVGEGGRQRPPWYSHLFAATTGVGTHPTGMHSYYRYSLFLSGYRAQSFDGPICIEILFSNTK